MMNEEESINWPVRSDCQTEAVAATCRPILTEVLSACNSTEATLWLFSEDGSHLDGTLNTGEKHEVVEELSVPVDDSQIGIVAAIGHPMCVGPDSQRNPLVEEKTRIEVTSMAVVPLFVDDELCGVLSTINPRAKELFDEVDLRELQVKADRIGDILATRRPKS